ncbi:MAG: bifunctional precorrin-2 dehydrogenase/sirohydrochlorin ferrochelatase [Ruminococcaceae bacterium]|nr:bifunctional precorrin-2 dehydrogenase/sirohydrochlorin ferrochelatase [Oscillospiraceae bacterium]
MPALPANMNIINEKGKHLPFAKVCGILSIYSKFGEVTFIVKHGFPLYIDLNGNNCTVFGGGEYAADKAETLLKFGAKVTVISPSLCERLLRMDADRTIRYIPRKYYRGDCTTSVLCVAATDDDAVNIAIATESKAKNIPVHVSHPAAFGNFLFPEAILTEHVQISLVSDGDTARLKDLRDRIQTIVAEYEE